MSVKTAEAVWKGSLTEGSGHLKAESGKLDTDYAWKSRAEDGPGTNPEELIAAAHAGCYSMALSHMLADAGHAPERLHTVGKVTFDKVGDGFGITKIKLILDAKVLGISEEDFQKHAQAAKTGCPVSKALSVPIELEATLSS
jgi:osmotically inducible protein OsmC